MLVQEGNKSTNVSEIHFPWDQPNVRTNQRKYPFIRTNCYANEHAPQDSSSGWILSAEGGGGEIYLSLLEKPNVCLQLLMF